MKSKSRFISLSAILSAFAVVMLYIASVMPSGQLGFAALAALFGIASVIETGIKGGISVYAVTSILSFLIVPDKTVVIFYILFFGNYPIIKSIAENKKSRVFEWAIKFIAANIELAVILLITKEAFFNYLSFSHSYLLIFILFNVVFFIFDIGVSKAIGFYISKISEKINR